MNNDKPIDMPTKYSKVPEVHNRRKEIIRQLKGQEYYVRAWSVGGTDGSHHSSDLAALCKQGHVLRERYSIGFLSGGHWRYKLTKAIAAIDATPGEIELPEGLRDPVETLRRGQEILKNGFDFKAMKPKHSGIKKIDVGLSDTPEPEPES